MPAEVPRSARRAPIRWPLYAGAATIAAGYLKSCLSSCFFGMVAHAAFSNRLQVVFIRALRLRLCCELVRMFYYLLPVCKSVKPTSVHLRVVPSLTSLSVRKYFFPFTEDFLQAHILSKSEATVFIVERIFTPVVVVSSFCGFLW